MEEVKQIIYTTAKLKVSTRERIKNLLGRVSINSSRRESMDEFINKVVDFYVQAKGDIPINMPIIQQSQSIEEVKEEIK